MFILTTQTKLDKAIEKAKKQRPKVKFLEFGVYLVQGSKGNFYRVICKRENGKKIVDCECKGGQEGLVCFHSVCGIGYHVAIARQRQLMV